VRIYRLPEANILLAKAIPIASVLAIAVSSLVFIRLGMFESVKKGVLFVGIPVITVSFLTFLIPGLFKERDHDALRDTNISSRLFIYPSLLFVFIFMITIALILKNQTRHFEYFFLIAAMAVIILSEIFFFNDSRSRSGIILTQIASLVLNTTLGFTLKCPMVTFADIFYHMQLINTFISKGYVSSDVGLYQFFPLFHIFNAMGTMLTGAEIKESYFVVNTLSFILSVPLVYILTNYATKNTNMSLLSALIYAFSRPAVSAGLYTVTRTDASILCLMVLYLLLKGRSEVRFTALAVFMILPLNLLHQYTLVAFTSILGMLFLIEIALHKGHKISYNYILLFVISYLAYWVYVGNYFFAYITQKLSATSEAVSIPSAAAPVIPAAESFTISLIYNLDFAIVTFMAMIGVIYQLNRRQNGNFVGHTLAVCALCMLPLYFPFISELFRPLLGYRFPFIVAPFIASVAGIGMSRLFKPSIKRQWCNRAAIIFIFVIAITFFLISSTLIGKSTDFQMLSGILGNERRGYLTQSEINSFNFYNNHFGDEESIYTDFMADQYMKAFFNLTVIPSNEVFSFETLPPNSYFIFRYEEYNSGGLDFVTKITENTAFSRSQIETAGWRRRRDVAGIWSEGSKLYDNGSVYIYKK